ncbi:hypothetical protein STANM309S_00571 [Streptomyces tanashiensis]
MPKYYRLKRHLLDMTETLPPGTPVPPERTLAAEFDTSRTTVRQALQELVVEGRLERIQGKGTFVAKPKVSQALQLTSYTEDMRAQGLEPTSQLLDIGYVTADDTLAGLLDISAGGRVLRIERLRLASGEPMAIETTHLSAKRLPALRRSLVKYTSLYTALAEVYDVHLAEAEQEIHTRSRPRARQDCSARTWACRCSMLSRHSLDAQGEPVELVRSVYRGDRYKFVARQAPQRLSLTYGTDGRTPAGGAAVRRFRGGARRAGARRAGARRPGATGRCSTGRGATGRGDSGGRTER